VELIGPTRAGVLGNLLPVFGAVTAVVVIGEPFRLHHALGLAFVLLGILIAEAVALRAMRT